MDLIDNTEMFSHAMDILALSEKLLTRLDEIPDKTPKQEETYGLIKEVVSIQSSAIRKLLEHQAQITDRLNHIITTHL